MSPGTGGCQCSWAEHGSRSLLPFHCWLEALITFSLKDLKKNPKTKAPVSVISQAWLQLSQLIQLLRVGVKHIYRCARRRTQTGSAEAPVPQGGQGEVGPWHVAFENRRSRCPPCARSSCQVCAKEEPGLENSSVELSADASSRQSGTGLMDAAAALTARTAWSFCSRGACRRQLRDAP